MDEAKAVCLATLHARVYDDASSHRRLVGMRKKDTERGDWRGHVREKRRIVIHWYNGK